MKTASLPIAAALSLLLAACNRSEPAPAEPLELTVKDIMAASVDPAGDALFESIMDISDEQGVRRVEPRTDADWAAVKRRAAELIEASRLLAMPGRKAARPQDRSANPEVENQPEEIQQLLDSQHDIFVQRADGLAAAARQVSAAADARSVARLETSLVVLDQACERCHLRFWYPRDEHARRAAAAYGVTP